METALVISWPVVINFIFYFLLIFYAGYSAILYYHWNNYSLETRATNFTYLAFFGISLPLILIMFASLYFI